MSNATNKTTETNNQDTARTDEQININQGVSSEVSREIAQTAALAADAKSATDIRLFDVSGITDICEYVVVASGSNGPLMDAVIDEIERRVAKACKEHPFSIEGREQRNWILMDYGSVVVHLFSLEAREFYRLEDLWDKAIEVEF